MEIYLMRGDQQEGPYEDSVIREMVGRGELGIETLAWREGSPDWQPVTAFFPPPPPVRPMPSVQAYAPEPPQQAGQAQERRLWTGHPSFLFYVLRLVAALPFLAFGAGGLAISGNDGFPPGLGLFFLGAGVLLLLSALIGPMRRTYVVTTRKVMVETGLVIKSSDEIRIRDIRSIYVRKHFPSALFGIGSLELSSAARDKAEVIFDGIGNANAIRDLVRNQQE